MVDSGPNSIVPNLRGGIPAWVFAAAGLVMGALTATVPVVVTIARMPDGTNFKEVTSDVAEIKKKLAVAEERAARMADLDAMKAKMADERAANKAAIDDAKAKLDDQRNQITTDKLNQLIGKRSK